MIITKIGKISPDLYMLANDAMPVYLLDGDKPALFDAGLAFLGDIYVQAIKEVHGSRTPVYCFLTHSHFDHCGSVSVLMCSETAGVPDQTGDIISDFLVDYDRYVDSMRRLNNLDVEVLCLGHRFAFTGVDAKEYIPKAITSCEKFLKCAEACFIAEAGDLQNIIRRVKEFEYDDKPGPKQLEAAYTLNLESRIKVIQKRIENCTN